VVQIAERDAELEPNWISTCSILDEHIVFPLDCHAAMFSHRQSDLRTEIQNPPFVAHALRSICIGSYNGGAVLGVICSLLVEIADGAKTFFLSWPADATQAGLR